MDRKINTELETQDIKCTTFLDTEKIIKRTDTKIKETRNTKERRYYAGDILLEAKALLSCSNYNAENPECLNCRSILREYIQEYEYLVKNKRQKDIIGKWLSKNRPHPIRQTK